MVGRLNKSFWDGIILRDELFLQVLQFYVVLILPHMFLINLEGSHENLIRLPKTRGEQKSGNPTEPFLKRRRKYVKLNLQTTAP